MHGVVKNPEYENIEPMAFNLFDKIKQNFVWKISSKFNK